ncbi:MAG: flagellar basal body rod protein FlgB [Rhizobiaceae bacterium]|nr:flagellar basal body rod protein FlgB [Rhizobiaceae bacterium]
MQPVTLFDLASQQAKWLSVRQSAVSGNIANANTPGYKAVDVQPFERLLDNRAVTLVSTNPQHLSGPGGGEAAFQVSEIEPSGPEMPSKNTVTLEEEMMKSGEVRRGFELNTAIVKSFHRMLMMTTRA